MKGAILEKGETGYTYLKKLFLSIRHAQKDFNWLITDCQCCTQSEAFYQRIFQLSLIHICTETCRLYRWL